MLAANTTFFSFPAPIESSLLQALDGGRLILALIIAPWCDMCTVDMEREASLAADMIDSTFVANFPSRISKPLIGIVDSSVMESLDIAHYPSLKFLITLPSGKVQILDFLAPGRTAKEFHDTLMMYWYRFIVSNGIGEIYSPLEVGKPSIFTFTSLNGLTSFVRSHGDFLLQPVQTKHQHRSKLEEKMPNLRFTGVSHVDIDVASQCNQSAPVCDDANSLGGDSTKEIEPFILLIQCLSGADYGELNFYDGDGIVSVTKTLSRPSAQCH